MALIGSGINRPLPERFGNGQQIHVDPPALALRRLATPIVAAAESPRFISFRSSKI